VTRPRFTLCVALCLLLTVGAAWAGDDPFRLASEVEPTFQAIELVLDADDEVYTGNVRIRLRVHEPTTTVRFHAQDLDLMEVVLSDEGGHVAAEHSTGAKGLVTLQADHELAAGEYLLEITFANEYNRKAGSLYKVEYEGNSYLYTQFEAEFARQAFPCFDEPGFKFPYQMTITVPSHHIAVANTPIEREEAAGDGMTRYTFHRTQPMPSYLLALATGPLEAVPIAGLSVPGRILTVKGQGHLAADAIEITPPILTALEAYFDRPYPYRKLDVIAIPEFLFGAMENVGAITFRDDLLLMDPDTRSMDQRSLMTMIMAHEIAHMWFGNLVTPAWWDDLWLNEAFATWIAYKVTDQVYPEFKYTVSDVKEKQKAMQTDALPSARPVYTPFSASDDPMSLADKLIYDKGQAVLSMTEAWLGEETFRKGMILHMERHEWGNATSDDLWLSLATAAGQDVAASIRSFIDQPGVPVVSVRMLADNRIELSQRRFANVGAGEVAWEPWGIPVVLRYSDGTREYTQHILLDEVSRSVELAAPGRPIWMHPNKDEKGYYRWSLPSTLLDALAVDGIKNLSVRERVGMVDNLGALLDAGELRGDEYLEAVRVLSEDPEAEVMKSVLEAVQRIYADLVTEELTEQFGVYVQKTLGPALERIGLEARAGEDEGIGSVRGALIEWLTYAGDDNARLFANELARRHQKDRASIDGAIAGSVLRAAASQGGEELFDAYVNAVGTAATPQERVNYLDAIARFQEADIVDRALEFALSDAVRPHEVWRIPYGLSRNHRLAPRVFNWFTANYEDLAAKMPPMYVGYTVPAIVDGNSAELLQAASDFMAAPERRSPMFDKEFKKVTERVMRRVRVMDKEGPRVDAYLRELSYNR